MTNNNYTDQTYWEGYYNKRASYNNIVNVCSAYDAYFDVFVDACRKKPEEVIEIGAYPGRYLAYLGSKYKIRPVSLDFNSDRTNIENAFRIMDVKDYEIIQADFEKFKSDKKYDLVISSGFIEHFENFDAILDKHAALLSDEGVVMVSVPNMRYLRRWYASVLDRENLKIHNLKCMKEKVFMDFVKRNDLELVKFGYFGGFYFSVHRKLNALENIVYQAVRKLSKASNSYLSKHPNKYTASSIICIARKKKA